MDGSGSESGLSQIAHEEDPGLKRWMAVWTVAAVMLVAAAIPSKAAEVLKISLTNSTGYTISELWIAPSGNKDYGDDDECLKGESFNDGETVTITYTARRASRHW